MARKRSCWLVPRPAGPLLLQQALPPSSVWIEVVFQDDREALSRLLRHAAGAGAGFRVLLLVFVLVLVFCTSSCTLCIASVSIKYY